MSTAKRHSLPFLQGVALLLAGLLLLAIFAIAFVFATATMTGSARLPNGNSMAISTGASGYSVAEKPNSTTVDLGGRTFIFSSTGLTVDGVAVHGFDAARSGYSLIAEDGEVQLISASGVVPLPPAHSARKTSNRLW